MPRSQTRRLVGTAFHEAGHAVVHAYHELPFDEATIVPSDGAAGSFRHPGPIMIDLTGYPRSERRRVARQMILGTYAGLHAERLVHPRAPEWRAAGDHESAWQMSVDYQVLPRTRGWVGDDGHQRLLRRLDQESRRLVTRLRRPIEALADALLQRQTMTEAEVLAIVNPILGR